MYQPHDDGIHSDPATNMEIRVKGRENGCILARLHPELCPFYSRTLHTTRWAPPPLPQRAQIPTSIQENSSKTRSNVSSLLKSSKQS